MSMQHGPLRRQCISLAAGVAHHSGFVAFEQKLYIA